MHAAPAFARVFFCLVGFVWFRDWLVRFGLDWSGLFFFGLVWVGLGWFCVSCFINIAWNVFFCGLPKNCVSREFDQIWLILGSANFVLFCLFCFTLFCFHALLFCFCIFMFCCVFWHSCFVRLNWCFVLYFCVFFCTWSGRPGLAVVSHACGLFVYLHCMVVCVFDSLLESIRRCPCTLLYFTAVILRYIRY